MPEPNIAGEISKIALPNGNVYSIKDEVARQGVSTGGTFVLAWNGVGEPDVSKIPSGVAVTYSNNGTAATATGILAAGTSTLKQFYLVYSDTQNDSGDVYDEYITVDNGESASPRYSWERLGDTQIQLSQIVKNVTKTTKKLATTSITGVSGSTSASKIKSAKTTQTLATGFTTFDTANTNTNTAFLKGFSISNETLTIGGVTLDTTTAGDLVESVTVPTAAAEATTVATGAVADNDTNGASILTDISVTK